MASERQRCDELWREEGRGGWGDSTGARPPKGGWSKTGDGMEEEEEETGWGTEAVSHTEAYIGGSGKFSLTEEIKNGRSRKEVLQEMVDKTKGYYARDYSL